LRSKTATDTRVSVLIPTHNRVDLLLERALPSVLAQTHTDMDIHIVQHGCWYSIEWPQDERILVHHIERDVHYPDNPWNRWYAGPVDPLNHALSLATGAYIARIDDDDTWEPDHLEKCLRFMDKFPTMEFVSAGHATHDNDHVDPYLFPGNNVIGGTQTWVYRSYLKMFKYNRNCWRNASNRVNDTDLQYRMYRAGVRMGYLNEVHAHVLPRPGETEIGLKAYVNIGRKEGS